MVIDSRLAFVGGINIVDDNNAPEGMRPRFDYAVRLEGPVLRQVHHAVRHMWEIVSWASLKRRFRQARMAPAGELSVNANRTDPYSRYSVSLQPLDWLEGSFRYTAITNRPYGSEALSGSQSYKDKAVDAKVRLWQESHWAPEVALGFRDIGGTGLFSSEFFVANKRFDNFDFSAGIAWGYLGNRGDLDNLRRKLDLHNLAALTKYAIREGLVTA